MAAQVISQQTSTTQANATTSFAPDRQQAQALTNQAALSLPTGKPQPRVRMKVVALPAEHGGWGLALEPLVLGLCVAPNLPGLFLALATVAAFLTRHPLKIVAGDRRRGRRFPRTPIAERFVLAYSAIALLSFSLAVKTAPTVFLLPLLIAAPFAILQLVYDATGRSRELLPELSGATALAAVAASIALAAGWSLTHALTLWALLAAARVIPSILYVRARLQQNHGKPANIAPAIAAHLLGCAVALTFAWLGLAQVLAVVAALILLLRAAYALSPVCPQFTAKQVGFSEIAFGLINVLALACGYAFRL
jgi:hypothetical protein